MYAKYVRLFKEQPKEKILVNDAEYECVKIVEGSEVQYIFFSAKLAEDQLQKKRRKFEKELKENDSKLRKVKKGKDIAKYISRKGYIIAHGSLQGTLEDMQNPYITGLEGYFILESSVDAEPEKNT